MSGLTASAMTLASEPRGPPLKSAPPDSRTAASGMSPPVLNQPDPSSSCPLQTAVTSQNPNIKNCVSFITFLLLLLIRLHIPLGIEPKCLLAHPGYLF